MIILSTKVCAVELNEDNILVPSAIMIEINSNKILYEKNSSKKMYPASLTKIMTAIIVLENCSLLEKTKVSYNAISNIPNGYETANLIVDEVLTIEELINMMLIQSANDAANVLAEHIANSIESFVSLMNTKAYKLGCKNTHFTNPYGLHDENHYSTAYDLYLISKHAMQNDIFKNIVRKRSYTVQPTNKTAKEREIKNPNKLLNPSGKYYDERVIGIKTGYTTPAGNCLITCATENNIDVIIVTLGGGLTYEEPSNQQYTSTLELINYAFDNYSYKTLNKSNSIYKTIRVENATEETKNLKILVKSEITAFVDNNTSEITPKVELKEKILAPIKKGQIIGKITYNILDTEYSSNLIAECDVEISKSEIYTFWACMSILVIFLIIKILLKKRKKKIY